jgi:hypothetical protein
VPLTESKTDAVSMLCRDERALIQPAFLRIYWCQPFHSDSHFSKPAVGVKSAALKNSVILVIGHAEITSNLPCPQFMRLA